MTRFIFLKLGGSLITDKTRPYTPRPDKLAELVREMAAAIGENKDVQLLLGHGSGSFGHEAASHHDTHRSVSTPEGWRGFAEVWYQASALNRLVMEALRQAGIPAIAFPPSASLTGHDGKVAAWDLAPLRAALASGLLPVIYGDVIFDDARGGTILSTEELFAHLARAMRPQRVLLAGLEAGVWEDFPARTRLIAEITPQDFLQPAAGLGRAAGVDVTGGMESKVRKMLALVETIPGLDILIFSGEKAGNIRLALRGGNPGTLIHR